MKMFAKKTTAFSLTLTLSRWEKEQPLGVLLCAHDFLAAGRFYFAKMLGAFLPLLGERAGVREFASTI